MELTIICSLYLSLRNLPSLSLTWCIWFLKNICYNIREAAKLIHVSYDLQNLWKNDCSLALELQVKSVVPFSEPFTVDPNNPPAEKDYNVYFKNLKEGITGKEELQIPVTA